METEAIFLRVDAHGTQAKFVGRAKNTNSDFAAIGSEQFLDALGLRHQVGELRLARNLRCSHDRGKMPQEFFQYGRRTKVIERGKM
jgi:hypothetical protein